MENPEHSLEQLYKDWLTGLQESPSAQDQTQQWYDLDRGSYRKESLVDISGDTSLNHGNNVLPEQFGHVWFV